MRNFTCTSCGANLQIDDTNRDFAFCQYCGSKIMFDDYRSTYRIIDEARLFEAETERIRLLREYEIEDERQRQAEEEKARRADDDLKYKRRRLILQIIWVLVVIILGIIAYSTFSLIMVCIFFTWFFVGFIYIFHIMPSAYAKKHGGIQFPKGLEPFNNQTVRTMEYALKNAGFKNITRVNVHDIRLGLLKRENQVQSIKINGEEIQDGGKYYMPDVHIVITYHGR